MYRYSPTEPNMCQAGAEDLTSKSTRLMTTLGSVFLLFSSLDNAHHHFPLGGEGTFASALMDAPCLGSRVSGRLNSDLWSCNSISTWGTVESLFLANPCVL